MLPLKGTLLIVLPAATATADVRFLLIRADECGRSEHFLVCEHIIYYRDKIVGGVYDDRFLVKPVKNAKNMMPEAELELPYEGDR